MITPSDFEVFRAEIFAILGVISTKLTNQGKDIHSLMAAIDDINTAQAAEKADLATLVGLIVQLLTAFASSQMTPAQAQALLSEINSEDSTIKSNTASIQKALGLPTT